MNPWGEVDNGSTLQMSAWLTVVPDRFRLVPFLTELRAVMDWVWTDTTLSLSSWICVEDIYAHIFILKCWRESEKVKGAAKCLLPACRPWAQVGYKINADAACFVAKWMDGGRGENLPGARNTALIANPLGSKALHSRLPWSAAASRCFLTLATVL